MTEIKTRIKTESWIPLHYGEDSGELLKKYHFTQEEAEEARFNFNIKTPYPRPIKRYRVVWETFRHSMEESYFWILNYLRFDLDFPEIYKIDDIFSASENSSFFGVNQQRLGLQQDKVSQFLAIIGKMVKELFQLVRELRILDERLDLYHKSYEGHEAAEISLKGYWIDLVEGGAKNPASVYGMARDLGFLTLPDLFFSAPEMQPQKVDKYVESLGFNRKVKEVLKRKLFTFSQWKHHTFKELKSRRIFTLKYLKQHYSIIQMYMTWVKPYLKNIKRLHLQDYTKSPHLVAAFEGSIVEIEILAVKKASEKSTLIKGTRYNTCILAHFFYRLRPEMSYQQEGYQRGPLHVGRLELNIRGYVWTDNQIKNYLAYKQEEDLNLLKNIDETVKAAYEALGEELQKYLKEAESGAEEKKPERPQTKGIQEPFVNVLGGIKELFTAFTGVKKDEKKPKKINPIKLLKQKEQAHVELRSCIWNLYDKYKKSHGMIAW